MVPATSVACGSRASWISYTVRDGPSSDIVVSGPEIALDRTLDKENNVFKDGIGV